MAINKKENTLNNASRRKVLTTTTFVFVQDEEFHANCFSMTVATQKTYLFI